MLQSTVGVDKQYWKIGSGDFLACVVATWSILYVKWLVG